MYEIVNKGLIILNGVYSGVTRHNINITTLPISLNFLTRISILSWYII
jgi:hypothetical protein